VPQQIPPFPLLRVAPRILHLPRFLELYVRSRSPMRSPNSCILNLRIRRWLWTIDTVRRYDAISCLSTSAGIRAVRQVPGTKTIHNGPAHAAPNMTTCAGTAPSLSNRAARRARFGKRGAGAKFIERNRHACLLARSNSLPRRKNYLFGRNISLFLAQGIY